MTALSKKYIFRLVHTSQLLRTSNKLNLFKEWLTLYCFTFKIDDIAQTGDALVDIEIADGDKDSSDSDSSSDSDAEVQELEAINVGEGSDLLNTIRNISHSYNFCP